LVILSGAPGAGKTTLSFDLAYRLATGSDFLNKKVREPVSVLYWSLEMEVFEVKYILDHQGPTFSKEPLWNKNLRIMSFEDYTFKVLEASIQKHKPSVIFIDSLSELIADGSSEQEAKQLMKWFKKMRRDYNCSFVVIHHNRKAQDSNKMPNKLSDLHGSFVFAAKSETVLTLWEDTKKGTLELIVLKARFDRSEVIRLQRNPDFTFSIKEVTSVSVSGDNPLIKANLGFGG
jgi:RecA-family ATPase